MGGPGWSTRAPREAILHALRSGEWMSVRQIAAELPRYTESQCRHGVGAVWAGTDRVEMRTEGRRRWYRLKPKG